MSSSKAEYRQVKQKLRQACSQRRIRLEEFMKTFDIHKTKKISVEQFGRAIDASGIRLTAVELNHLIEKYRCPEDSRSVDYRRCCDLIDKPCTMKKVENHLKMKKEMSKSNLDKNVNNDNYSTSDNEALRSIKEKLSNAMRVKGIVLKDVFHDFDKNNSGYVTKTRFVRDLCTVVGEVSATELDAIIKAYEHGGLDVNYKQLHYDLMASTFPTLSINNNQNNNDSPPTMHQQLQNNNGLNSSPRPRRRTINSSPFTDVEGIEAPLREIVARDRIRMKNFFTDYDRMRSGKCTEGQFQRALKVCFGALTENDLKLLVSAYEVPCNDASNERKVDYISFCQRVSSSINDESNIEKEPNTEVNNHDNLSVYVDVPILPTAICTRLARGQLTDGEMNCWHQAMTRLSHTVSTRRILLKPLFCDFDRGKTECVTCDQFARVLAMFNMFLQSPEEQAAIVKRYASARLNTLPPTMLQFDNKTFINYKTFCLDMEEYQELLALQRSTKTTTPSILLNATKHEEIVPAETSLQRTFPMLLRYIKQKAKRDRIRVEEYFRDFDRLRKGKITRSQFASGLNTGGFVLSKIDIEILANEFKYMDDIDVEGHPLVAWHRFVDEIESVFTVKGLERDPTRDIRQTIEQAEQTTAWTDTPLQSNDETIVVQLLQEMAVTIQHQRLDLKPSFEDFDHANQGFISSSKFERVLSIFNLLPSNPTTTRLLVMKFSERGNAPQTGVSSTCDVNYRAFLSSLESVQQTPDAPLLGAREFRLRQAQTSGANELSTEATRRLHKPPQKVTLQSLLKDIRLQVDTKRIRIKQFFTESDRLRSGEISLAKFHTAINRSGLHLDANDIHTLNEAYKSTTKPDQIQYRAFIAAIEATVHVEDCRDEIPPMKQANSDQLEAILSRIRNVVDVKRLHMKPYFEDYDRNYLMHVTKTQFASVLDMMQVGCSPSEIALLTSAYCVRHGREVNPDVNYLRFIQDIDQGYSHLKHPVGVKAAVKPPVK